MNQGPPGRSGQTSLCSRHLCIALRVSLLWLGGRTRPSLSVCTFTEAHLCTSVSCTCPEEPKARPPGLLGTGARAGPHPCGSRALAGSVVSRGSLTAASRLCVRNVLLAAGNEPWPEYFRHRNHPVLQIRFVSLQKAGFKHFPAR